MQGKLQQWPYIKNINETLNQCSVYGYASSIGVSPHIDQPCLGAVIATANYLSDVTIDFLPKGEGTPFSNRALRHSFTAITSVLRTRWCHGIEPRDFDIVGDTEVEKPRMIFRCVP